MLSIFSRAFWPSVCLLWRDVYLGLLPIFWLAFFDIELLSFLAAASCDMTRGKSLPFAGYWCPIYKVGSGVLGWSVVTECGKHFSYLQRMQHVTISLPLSFPYKTQISATQFATWPWPPLWVTTPLWVLISSSEMWGNSFDSCEAEMSSSAWNIKHSTWTIVNNI